MGRVTPLRKTANSEWTPSQEKFWDLLQEEKNRVLSIQELCALAGYRSINTWYDAIRDERFCTRLKAVGISPRLRASPGQGMIPLAENADEEWEKDRVDLRRLTTEYPKHCGPSAFLLDFSCIANTHLRQVVKRYFRAKMHFWGAITLKNVLGHMKPFFMSVSQTYPDMRSFADLTRCAIEPFLTQACWTNPQGRTFPMSSEKKHFMVSDLQAMFRYMQHHEWEGAPTQSLLYEEDRPKRPRRRPRPIPQEIFERLLEHAHLLPPHAHNLVAILAVVGLRAEDAMHLPENCVVYDAAGDPRLLWYNHKLKRDGRPLPVTTTVVEAIERQREVVKTIPDHFGKCYLFRTKHGLYQFGTFCEQLNRLAAHVPLLDSIGQVYHFKPHQMRHTVGTQMINNGMGIADVMAYLDHISPEMTLQYTEIDDDKLKQKFKALVLSGQAVGGAALKALKEQLENGNESELDWVISNLRKLSLPWGQCLHHAKANKCPYGQNVCFTKDHGPCHKLVTTPEHAPVIMATMEDLKRSKQIAEEKGWEMYANDLTDQINGMQQVLAELQLPADQRAKNRGGTK